MFNFVKSCMLLIFLPATLFAQSPNVLILWQHDNAARITFDCSPVYGDDMQPSQTEIDCKSTTTFFDKQEGSDDFELKWQEGISEISEIFDDTGQVRQNQTYLLEACSGEIVDIMELWKNPLDSSSTKLTDKQIADFVKKKAAMPIGQRDDNEKTALQFIKFCEDLSIKSFKEFMRLEFNKSTRTCTFFNQSTTERYTRINDNLWVSKNESGILDPCQRITISSLKLPEGGRPWDWEFEYRSISLDKDAEYLGTSCAELEEKGTDLYTYRSEPVFLGCDYFAN